MRILIGNHIEDSLLTQVDMRMFIHRIFWFAEDNDLIILPCEPELEFIRYVTNLLKIEFNSLQIVTTPLGRFDGKLFDPFTLLNKEFQEIVKELCQDVTEILPLWPSSHVARFAKELNLAHALPGSNFFLQSGEILANSKANFRTFASALGCNIAQGGVCRTHLEAENLMLELLQIYPAVVVKQEHNGAGAGNQIVYMSQQLDSDSVGMKFKYDLLQDPLGVKGYLGKRWEWATDNGRFPVVIESYIPHGRTVYAEFYAADEGLYHLACGSLIYENGKLVQEIAPLRWLPLEAYNKLMCGGQCLAEFYRQLGYRGYLSADALYDRGGKIWFTEMNARIGGSPHIYRGIGERLVDVYKFPNRIITQYNFNPEWKLENTLAVLEVFKESGLAYQTQTRRGLILSTPPIGSKDSKPFMLCFAHREDENPQQLYNQINTWILEHYNEISTFCVN